MRTSLRWVAVAVAMLVMGWLVRQSLWERPGEMGYFPVEGSSAPNYHQVVSARWLSEGLAGLSPPRFAGLETLVILEVSGGDDAAYRRGHVPGARLLLTDTIEKPPLWNLIPPEKLQDVLEDRGISRDSMVVVYGPDVLAVARVLWALIYAGVDDVRLLDGGLKAWKRFGGELERGAPEVDRKLFGGSVPLNPEVLATLSDIDAVVAGGDGILVDVRSRAEFDGRVSGYDYISAKGKIPSAVWGGEAKASTFASLEGVAERWKPLMENPEMELTFYCGTGWRSSLAFFYARVLGYEKARNFDGSWLEWSQRAATREKS